MNDEQVILAAVAQGQIDDIVQSGVLRWEVDEPYNCILKACQVIRLRGEALSLLGLHSECSLPQESWVDIREIWREARSSERINWRPAVERIVTRAMLSSGKDIAESLRYSLNNGIGPRQALANAYTKLNTLLDTGSLYNPMPSHHYREGVIGQVVSSTGLRSLDAQLRGGLWSQALIILMCPSNHGKSTMMYTQLAHCIRLGIRCQLFTFETNTATAIARILSALTGLHTSETELRKGKNAENQQKIDDALIEMDKYLSIFDNTFNDPTKIEQVIRIERPAFAGIDHISMPNPKAASRNQNLGDVSAALAEAALQWTINYTLTIMANAQGSNDQQLELKKTHDIAQVSALGSSRIYNAADFFVLSMRHWSMPNVCYTRVKKDRKKGILDTEALLRHNPWTQSYEDMQ